MRQRNKTMYSFLNLVIALVWIGNGLFCKILNLVPRHRDIVARILGDEHAGLFTILIGIGELLIAIWILSGIKSKWATVLQIILIPSMNVLEFLLAPDLLLWGYCNAIFAMLFCLLLYYKEFKLSRN